MTRARADKIFPATSNLRGIFVFKGQGSGVGRKSPLSDSVVANFFWLQFTVLSSITTGSFVLILRFMRGTCSIATWIVRYRVSKFKGSLRQVTAPAERQALSEVSSFPFVITRTDAFPDESSCLNSLVKSTCVMSPISRRRTSDGIKMSLSSSASAAEVTHQTLYPNCFRTAFMPDAPAVLLSTTSRNFRSEELLLSTLEKTIN